MPDGAGEPGRSPVNDPKVPLPPGDEPETVGVGQRWLVTLPGHADRVIEAASADEAKRVFKEKHVVFNVQQEPEAVPVPDDGE